MIREHIQMVEDEAVEQGKPAFSGDGKNLSSIVVRYHPADKEVALAKVKAAIRAVGGTNIKIEHPV